jgi:hypothetical protein
MDDRVGGIAKEVKKIGLADVGWDKQVTLFQRIHGLNAV